MNATWTHTERRQELPVATTTQAGAAVPPGLISARTAPSKAPHTDPEPLPELKCTNLFQGLELATWTLCSDATAARPTASLGVETRTLDRLQVAEASTAQLQLQVAGEREQPSLLAWLQLEGRSQLTQRDKATEITAGELCLLRSARALTVTLGTGRLMLVALPEVEIADRFPLWRAALLAPISLRDGMPAFFADAIRALFRWQDGIHQDQGDQVADGILNLMGAVICCAVPDTSGCLERSLHRRQQVKRYIQRHLQDPNLNADTIAEGLKLSVRQVHRLFADESLSLMRWIWTARLQACHRELQNDPQGRRSLAEIAYTWGFNDQTHFSRAFRRQYGHSPSEFRRRPRMRTSEAPSPDNGSGQPSDHGLPAD